LFPRLKDTNQARLRSTVHIFSCEITFFRRNHIFYFNIFSLFLSSTSIVGKSTIAGLLRNNFPNSVKLDIDHLTGVNPLPDNTFGEALYAFVARTLQAIVPHYQREGYTNIIIPYVFEHRYQLISCVKSLSKPGQKVRLSSNLDLRFEIVCY
jgi:hypothetical protein